MTCGDRLDNRWSQERQPNQAANITRKDPFALGDHCNRFHSTRKQIVRLLAYPRDRLHEREIGIGLNPSARITAASPVR